MQSKILHRVPTGCAKIRVEYIASGVLYYAIIERPINAEHLNARMLVLRHVKPEQIKRVLPVREISPRSPGWEHSKEARLAEGRTL